MADAPSFANGLLAGFSVTDRLFERRRQQELDKKRLDLADRSQSLAERAHVSLDQYRQDAIAMDRDRFAEDKRRYGDERQDLDAARNAQAVAASLADGSLDDNDLIAGAQDYFGSGDRRFDSIVEAPDGRITLGVSGKDSKGQPFSGRPATVDAVPVAEGGEPITFANRDELRQAILNQAARYNPNIGRLLEQQSDRRQQQAGLRELNRHLVGNEDTGSLGAGDPATTQTQSPSGEVAQRPSLQSVVTGGQGFAPFGSTETKRMMTDKGIREVPADFMHPREMAELGMTHAEIQARKDEQDAFLNGKSETQLKQTLDERRAEQASATDKWGAFLDVNNSTGAHTRRLLADNPSAAIDLYRRDRNKLTPDVRRQVDLQMAPELRKEAETLLPAVREGDTTAARRYADLAKMEQQLYEDYEPGTAAGIRAQGMPITNAALQDAVLQAYDERPAPAEVPSPNQLRAAQTQVRRQVGSGRRVLPTTLINKLPFLVDAGLMSQPQLEELIRTGNIADPVVPGTDIKLESHNPENDLWAFNPATGAMQKVYTGQPKEDSVKVKEAREMMGERRKELEEALRTALKAAGMTGKDVDNEVRSFYVTANDHRDIFQNVTGIDPSTFEGADTARIAAAAQRYADFVTTRERNDSRRWVTWGPGDTFEEQGKNYLNFDRTAMAGGEDPTRTVSTDIQGLAQRLTPQQIAFHKDEAANLGLPQAKLPDHEFALWLVEKNARLQSLRGR